MKLRSLFVVAAAIAMTGVALWAKPTFPENVVKEPTKAPAMAKDGKPAGPLDLAVQDINGKDAKLSQYKGKVVMIVNVASKCGFTPQYEQLQAVYKKYEDKGFVILGFPANNFNAQEPGTDEQIEAFCKSKFGVTFPMMSKISVGGADKAPLYKFLTEKQTAGDFAGEIGWNFNKFIVDRNGNVIARYNSKAKPDDKIVVDEIEKALAAKGSVASR
ncbi:MAG TPA: glutathione peroxidase [Tepidisphaeraceae bacterium]|jgi:glutathione peroxidase